MMSDRKQQMREVVGRIGRKRITDALGLTPHVVANAIAEGAFPARWYLVLTAMAEEEGVECPPNLFRFVLPEGAE